MSTNAGLTRRETLLWLAGSMMTAHSVSAFETSSPIALPAPRHDGDCPVERALHGRRSTREFAPGPLSAAELGQVLWAVQGRTGPDGLRTAPSAGALYPLEVYAVVGDVVAVLAGVYRYDAARHALVPVRGGDQRRALAGAALDQMFVASAPAVLVLTSVDRRTTAKYGERGLQYVPMEAGHAGQNAYLQAFALGLGTAAVGAFRDDRVREVLGAPKAERPVYVLPLGPVRPGGPERPLGPDAARR